MRVLVTGHRGYIGSVLTCVLRNNLCDVVGLDADLFDGADFGRVDESVPAFDTDIRDVEFQDLTSFDAVIHLAGLSDDASALVARPAADEINIDATIRLAECCKRAGVSRLVFASSCAVYGENSGGVLTEREPANPIGFYASSKLVGEEEILRLADGSFAPVVLRSGTVYGVSPRLRLDTVVNDFVASAAATGRVRLQTAGHAYRPLVHVEDLARVYLALLTGPVEAVHGEVFNVVPEGENHRVIDIADEVAGLVPGCVRETPAPMADRCSYRADGSKLRAAFPKLALRWNLTLGVRQLYNAMCNAGLTAGDWRSDRYRRAPSLRGMLEAGQLDDGLRRREPVVAVGNDSPSFPTHYGPREVD